MRPLIAAMRPRQWVKNLFVLPALLFSNHFLDWTYVGPSLLAVLCFCLLSSAIYLVNDLFDLERDRAHPEKSKRPIASGLLSPRIATATATLLAAVAVVMAFRLHSEFGFLSTLYAGLNLAYSVRLKRVVLIDVLIVATGYLLRALGGALAIQVYISTWFILCTFLLALFLAVVKRRQEIVVLDRAATQHREILQEYSIPFLDQIISVLTSGILICYALYAMGVGEQTGRAMQWTIPFVLYGILRYLFVVFQRGDGENPTAVVWQDRPLQISILLWLLACVLVIYGWPGV